MANDESTKITVASSSLKNLISAVPMLGSFPDKLVEELQQAASFVNVNPDEIILKQGEINKNLYFLVIGTVDIIVDGGLVATLRRKGDLLGEMSVITSRPCSATIVAKTPVELIQIDTELFRRITNNNQSQFDHILYRIYSQTLADKVSVTNQKAKKVEVMLEALERAKNELQEINMQMERRVVERTQALQKKFQELLTDHLQVLQVSLKEMSLKVDTAVRPALEKGLAEVDSAVNFLEPIVQRFTLEVSMKNRRVLLAQGERKSQTVAKMALGGTGVSIEAVATIDEARAKLASEKYDVVLVDSESLDLVDFVYSSPHQPHVVYVASKGIRENLPKLLNIKHTPNIVLVREDDRAGSIRTLMTTVTKLCSPNLFGLEKYLSVGVEVKELKICKSTERAQLNEEMKSYFSGLGIRGSILDRVGTVLEELLMNAIYDAPTDASGQAIYNKLVRTTVIDLKTHEQGLLRFATDGTLIAVSVQDPFGALSAKIIMNYLDSCYGERAGSLQRDKGGAGRGLHQIIENSYFVVFNIQPRRQTEVIAFFNVVPGEKESTDPMLHYFVQR